MKSYLTNRKQCVKLGSIKSDFDAILKGVPQEFILGPVLFNIFINDIFHFVKSCSLYNYADDKTVSCSDNSLENVICKLSEDSVLLIRWFLNNKMKASPEKIQAIAVGEKTKVEDITFNLDNNIIKCEETFGSDNRFSAKFQCSGLKYMQKGIKTVKCFKTDWQTLVQRADCFA